VVAEWFPVKARSTAMASSCGTASRHYPPLYSWIILTFPADFHRGLGFFITGTRAPVDILDGHTFIIPPLHPRISAKEREYLRPVMEKSGVPPSPIRISAAAFVKRGGFIGAISYGCRVVFYMFWLPKYLSMRAVRYQSRRLGRVDSVRAAAVAACRRAGFPAGAAARVAVSAARRSRSLSAAVIAVAMLSDVSVVGDFLFSVAFFASQSWSTLVMILPTTCFPSKCWA